MQVNIEYAHHLQHTLPQPSLTMAIISSEPESHSILSGLLHEEQHFLCGEAYDRDSILHNVPNTLNLIATR